MIQIFFSPMDNILNFIGSKQNVTEQELLVQFPRLNRKALLSQLKIFITSQSIEVFNDDLEVKYRIIKKTDPEQKILQIIESTEGKGITLSEIIKQSKLPKMLVNKQIADMEKRMIIKSIKGIRSRVKRYLLINQTINLDYLGGSLFNNGDVDVEFVSSLTRIILQFMKSKIGDYYENKSINDIMEYVKKSGIVSVGLGIEELELLLDVLVADELIEKLSYGGSVMYRRCV